MNRVLVFDPSGNWSKNEGKGSTGYAVFEDSKLTTFGDKKAEDYYCMELYWENVGQLIEFSQVETVVCESYKLQPGKAKAQSWSALETPQMTGYLRMLCWRGGKEFILQDPSIKIRVADPILEHMGIIEKRGRSYYCLNRMTSLHMRDAIRHGVYYHRYQK
jgi:hypothetical protein